MRVLVTGGAGYIGSPEPAGSGVSKGSWIWAESKEL
jgi:hypothetical protein